VTYHFPIGGAWLLRTRRYRGFLDGEGRVIAEVATLTRLDLGDGLCDAIERDHAVVVEVEAPARLEVGIGHVSPRP
jgi:hypothetical protein